MESACFGRGRRGEPTGFLFQDYLHGSEKDLSVAELLVPVRADPVEVLASFFDLGGQGFQGFELFFHGIRS